MPNNEQTEHVWQDAFIHPTEAIQQLQHAVDELRDLVLAMTVPTPVGRKEGETCNRDGCVGTMELDPPVNCSCHIDPPCSACVDPTFTCTECSVTVDMDGEETE